MASHHWRDRLVDQMLEYEPDCKPVEERIA